MREFIQDMTQEEIQNAINKRFSSMKEDGFYISSINTLAEGTNSPDKTITNIHYTITFEKIQVKRPKEILDKKEKEYLEHFLRPFKDRVSFISKYNCIEGFEYICIHIKDDTNTVLPDFEKNTMYKGMEPDKEYTIKELGLFKGE